MSNSEKPTCQTCIELVNEYVDCSLSAEQHELIEEHLQFCTNCQLYFASFKETIKLTRQSIDIEPDDAKESVDLVDKVLSALHNAKTK